MKDLIIIKNVLPEPYAQDIHNIVEHPDFPWVYSDEISLKVEGNPFKQNPEAIRSCGFSHELCVENRHSTHWSGIKPMLYFMAQRSGIGALANAVTYRCKANLQTQLNQSGPDNHNFPHIDPAHFNKPGDNWIFLYYVNDSDGDTFIFNEVAEDGLPDKLTVRKRITPKANTGVLFRDNIFHASSNPITSRRRLNLNFNLLVN